VSVQSGRVVGFVLFNPKSDRFVGRDRDSGGYPYESDTIGGVTIWPSLNEAGNYRAITGFERFNSRDWTIYPLVLG
jgi:hypothetical protein